MDLREYEKIIPCGASDRNNKRWNNVEKTQKAYYLENSFDQKNLRIVFPLSVCHMHDAHKIRNLEN